MLYCLPFSLLDCTIIKCERCTVCENAYHCHHVSCKSIRTVLARGRHGPETILANPFSDLSFPARVPSVFSPLHRR